jgi:DNA polymerase-3 subunit gamma/tau
MWPAVLEGLREEAPHLAPVLESARPLRVGDGELTLAWSELTGLYLRKVEDPANKETIIRIVRAVTGSSLRLAYEVRADVAPEAAPRVTEEELVDRFVQEFDAEILPGDEESR